MESGDKGHYRAPSATPWDEFDPALLNPAQTIVMACHRDIYRYRHAPTDLEGEARFFNAYEREFCPRCGSHLIRRHGYDANGIRRWMCRTCGRSFTPMTSTIFEHHRITVADWTEFVLGALSYESVNAMTRSNRRSATTLPYWMAKLFVVLDGIQDGIILRGRVQIDEMLYALPRKDQPKNANGTLMPGGYSKGKICIGIGCDRNYQSVFFAEGLGKTSKAKTLAAFGAHIASGSALVHDGENGHNALIRELELRSEVHTSKELKGVPDISNPLHNVNRLCYLLRAFLDAHQGFDRNQIQGYLDLFSVMMNPPVDKMAKAAIVLDRAMTNPKTLRYRDFYERNPSSKKSEVI